VIAAGGGQITKFQITKLQIPSALLHFLVRRVLPARIAKFLELETVRGGLPVLRRRVVLALAIRALQLNDFPRHS
jgi:hypothetical protein